MTEEDGTAVDPEPARCYRHPDRPTYVSCTRCDRPICPDCMRPASVGFHCPDDVADARRTVRQPQARYGGRFSETPAVTRALIAVNVAVFALTTLSGASLLTGSGNSTMFDRFALVPGRVAVFTGSGQVKILDGIAQGQYWRLVTSMFLHFGILHILSNMYVLYIVGPAVERALGRVRFVALYFIAGLGGSMLSYVLGPLHETAAGASGAIFGLFGAYYIIARRARARTGPIVAIVALNLVISVAVPFIDIRGHIGGLLTGAAVGAAFVYAPRARRTLVQVGGAVLITVALVVAVGVRTSAIRKLPGEAAARPVVQLLQR